MPRTTRLRSVATNIESARAPSLSFADVERVSNEGDVFVRVDRSREVVAAASTHLTGYRASTGDRVVIADDGRDYVIVAVVRSAAPPSLVSTSGTRARVDGDAISVFDAGGTLLVRARGGALEIAPATGDLHLSAPAGRIRLSAQADIEIESKRDIALRGARKVEVRAGVADTDLPARLVLDERTAALTGRRVELRAALARLVAGRADVVSRDVRTSADTITTSAKKIETTTERAIFRAKEVLEEVSDLLETRAGRLRALVKGALSVRSKVTDMKSEADTSIDGKRVLLG